MKAKLNSNDFTLMFGHRKPYEWIRTDKLHSLIITSGGVYWDGEIIAKGKLKLIKKSLDTNI